MAQRGVFVSLLGLVFLCNVWVQGAPSQASNTNGTQSNPPISPQTRIIDGDDAKEGQFPWQVAIVQDDSFFCGGSIIGPAWILTAGHCTQGVLVFKVTVGSIYSGTPPPNAREPSRQVITSLVGIPHPLYVQNPVNDNNDVGLVRLPAPLVFDDFVRAIPLALPTPEYLNLNFKTTTISGWGKTSDAGSVTPVLKYTDLRVIPGVFCTAVYGDIWMNSKICCSTLDGHSTCNGDSGGPLIYKGLDGIYREVGIVAYGSGSCVTRQPVVFTRVTSFLDFIATTTGLAP